MSRSSQTALLTVTFSTDLDPLTTTAKRLADDVERYLQRVAPGEVTVTVADDGDYGLAHQDGRIVSHFSFVLLGGAR